MSQLAVIVGVLWFVAAPESAQRAAADLVTAIKQSFAISTAARHHCKWVETAVV